MSTRTHVVIAGAGVAALETCLALHEMAGERVLTTIVAPNTYFAYPPTRSHDTLGVSEHVRVPVACVARSAGANLHQDTLASVDTAARRVRTASGTELSYDALVVAVGAVPLAVPDDAAPFDPRSPGACRSAVYAAVRGDLGSLAFVEPAAPTRTFELYDLAIDTAVAARRAGASPALTLVTAQTAPLAVAGSRAAELLELTLASHGVRVVESAHLRGVRDGDLDLVPAHPVFAARTIVAPRLGGRRTAGLPRDANGFLATDRLGRVQGADRVFAAGDCTAFPVKHPSIAAQQADAVAATIAGRDEPFTPVLRAMLPARLRWYLEAPLTGGHGDVAEISAHPLWPGDARFGARYLTPRLADLQDQQSDHGAGDGRDDSPVGARADAAAAVASH
jgi:sulfide:quinone oxidoreductase